MHFVPLISRTALPAYLRLKGLPVVRLVEEYEQSQWWSPERRRVQTNRKLQRLIRKAALDNPFYAARFRVGGLSPQDIRGPEDLPRLPMLEKRELADLQASVSPRGSRWVRRTAGTSGQPMTVLASNAAQAAALAARYRCYGWYGLRLGDREARFWGRPIERDSAASILRRTLLNRIPFDYRHVRTEAAADTFNTLLRNQVDYVYGYGSLILRLARQIERQGLGPLSGCRAVVLTAEATSEAERAWLGGVLDCRVADEYGCSEIDIISFTCPAGGRHVMSENVLLETVPVPGEPDLSELLVTDLNNELMPMIRYRLGDNARLTDAACPCGRTLPLLEGLQGRTQRQYLRTPAGELVHANPFPYFMEQQQGAGVPIRQFQIIQTALDEVLVRLVMDDIPVWERELRGGLETLVRTYYGEAMRCVLEWTDEIVPEPGHKFEYFINRLDRTLLEP